MCDLHHHDLPHLDADEYVLDTPFVRELDPRCGTGSPPRRPRPRPARRSSRCSPTCSRTATGSPRTSSATRPRAGWAAGSGSGSSSGSADRSLCLFSLVVPPGSATPVHDHLAWGLVGLYRGNQDEEFYNPRPGALELVRRRPLEPGDFYRAAPAARRHPPGAHDLGRHVGLDPPARERRGLHPPPHLRRAHGEASPFRSGYVNANCEPSA